MSKTKHKHYQAIRAFADGWKIEYFDSCFNKWIEAKYPMFAEDHKYRIVPDSDGCIPWYINTDSVKYRIPKGQPKYQWVVDSDFGVTELTKNHYSTMAEAQKEVKGSVICRADWTKKTC